MAAKAKKAGTVKREVKKTPLNHTMSAHDELYVSMIDPQSKRRDLLEGIKTALVMQEEQDRIVEIRREKAQLLEHIKRSMAKLNRDYQHLKKLLPNVKNVIAYTEKELMQLDSHIEMLKSDINADKEAIVVDKGLKRSMVPSKQIKEVGKKEEKAPENPEHKKNVAKIDRIKNNLKVIEGKLKKL